MFILTTGLLLLEKCYNLRAQSQLFHALAVGLFPLTCLLILIQYSSYIKIKIKIKTHGIIKPCSPRLKQRELEQFPKHRRVLELLLAGRNQMLPYNFVDVDMINFASWLGFCSLRYFQVFNLDRSFKQTTRGGIPIAQTYPRSAKITGGLGQILWIWKQRWRELAMSSSGELARIILERGCGSLFVQLGKG